MKKNRLFDRRLVLLVKRHSRLLRRRNRIDPEWTNGVFDRYVHPVLTAQHAPLF